MKLLKNDKILLHIKLLVYLNFAKFIILLRYKSVYFFFKVTFQLLFLKTPPRQPNTTNAYFPLTPSSKPTEKLS